MDFKKILAGMSALAIASTLAVAAFADGDDTSSPNSGSSTSAAETNANEVVLSKDEVKCDISWNGAVEIKKTQLDPSTLKVGDKIVVTAKVTDKTLVTDKTPSKVTVQDGDWNDIEDFGYPVVTDDKATYEFKITDAALKQIQEKAKIKDDTIIVKGCNITISKVVLVKSAATTTETPGIVVDTKDALFVDHGDITGKDPSKSDTDWEDGFFIDLTKYDVSKIDKIVVSYHTDATWANGCLQANLIDKSSKNGKKSTKAPGANLAWDLDDKGEPQHWGNSDEGIKFDVKTGIGSIEWTGLTGKLYQDKTDNVFDPENGGDSTGLQIQVGTINNPVASVAADGSKTYKAATFAVKSVKLYDKAGNEVKPIVAAPKASAVSKVTVKTSASTAALSWSKAKNAAGYNIYKYNTKTKKYTKVASTTKTSYKATKLTSGTYYKYAVEAYNKDKVPAAKKVVGVSTAIYAPSKLTVKNTAKGKATVSFAKSKTAGVKYKIYFKSTSKGAYKAVKSQKTTKFVKGGLKKGKVYYFAVKAYKTVGNKTVVSSTVKKAVKIAK